MLISFVVVISLCHVSPAAASPAIESHCFQNCSTTYSHLCATQAVRYSSVAYLTDIASITAWDCESCLVVPELEILKIFQGQDKENFGYIGVQKSAPRNVVLAFRGTSYDTTDSAIADLEFTERHWPEYVDKSTVDHGFLKYFLSVESDVRETLTDYLSKCPDLRLLITGHSLGGAISVIAAVALHDLIPDPLVYTFGSPRVGNSYFANFVRAILGTRVYRVIHHHDIVPHLPPCSWLPWSNSCEGPKFPTHIPTEVLYNVAMDEYTICSSEDGEDRRCCDQFYPTSLSIIEHLYYFGFRIGNANILAPVIIEPAFASIA